jgi:single-strand DNA-binding protein
MTTNRVTLVGYVGADLATQKLKNGSTRVALRIATHERKNNTTWHNVSAFNAAATYAAQNFVKGSRIMVEGFITYLPYADDSGRIHYSTMIQANYLVNLDR